MIYDRDCLFVATRRDRWGTESNVIVGSCWPMGAIYREGESDEAFQARMDAYVRDRAKLHYDVHGPIRCYQLAFEVLAPEPRIVEAPK